MNKSRSRIIWTVWAVMLICGLPLLYTIDPPRTLSIHTLAAVIIVAVITALFSFKVQGTDIIVLQGIGLAAFLIFGLFVEVVVTQVGIMTYLLTQRSKNNLYRIPLNSMMFLIVSICSAAAFYSLNGNPKDLMDDLFRMGLVPIVGYYMMSFISNELILFIYRRWIIPRKRIGQNFFYKDMMWEIILTLLMMPLGIAFYIMYSLAGVFGLIIIAVPMVALSIITRLINNSRIMVQFLQKVNQLGQRLTEELSVDQVLNLFFKKVPQMLSADYLYIVNYQDPERPKLTRINSRKNNDVFVPFQSEADISLAVYRMGRTIWSTNNRKKYPFLEALSEGNVQSYLSMPMMYHGQVIGVLTIASHQSRAYQKAHRIGMEIAGDFLAIALENARNFEKKKEESERCPLTNLYNYRYLMRTLDQMFDNPQTGIFSLIMLDIDNFKQVNDTYGHQNGNSLLIGLANRLRYMVGNKGITVRYGGEEFAILIPGMDRNMCFALAESIRQSVALDPFMIYLHEEHRYRQIKITVSLGLSVAPQDAKNPTELIYHADHALYTGAKHKGKNRVSR